jgi:LysR family glycine cleavage system transcriptional activator
MGLPSLNAIRAFETAARLGSFKDAAEELNLSPSAISRHIRSLESALGVTLFERGFREVELTEKARHYARQLSESFRIISDSTEEMRAYGPSRRSRKRITLSVNAAFMNLWLADRLPRFRTRCPHCDIEVSIHDDSGKGGNPRADLKILFAADDLEVPSTECLVRLSILAVCAPKLTEGRNALRRPADLAKHRLLHENTTAWWEEWIEAAGVTGIDYKAGAIFHDPTLAIREAVNGGGVALADNIMAEDLLRRGLLVEPFGIRRPIPNCYFLALRPGASSMESVRVFREWLVAEVEHHKRVMKIG